MFNDLFRFRAVVESIRDDLTSVTYTQDSYGLIYNQYADFSYFEINNYLESFYIPRVSKGTLDTFFKVQVLKSFYLNQTPEMSQGLFPFVEVKAKLNDDVNFGQTGHNGSAGLGYKFFGVTPGGSSNFSVVIEGSSIFYQSKNFNGDWFQSMVAVQWVIN